MNKNRVKDNTTQLALEKAWRWYGQPLLPSIIAMMGLGIYLVNKLGLPMFPYDMVAIGLALAIPFMIFQVFTTMWFYRSVDKVFCPEVLLEESVRRGFVLRPVARLIFKKKVSVVETCPEVQLMPKEELVSDEEVVRL